MSENEGTNDTGQLWIVVNDVTGNRLSKPCPRDVAEQIQKWGNEDLGKKHGYTYSIQPAEPEPDE